MKLMRSLIISIFLHACESWTLTAELEKRTQAFEMRCYRRLLNIPYKDHVINEEVRLCQQMHIFMASWDDRSLNMDNGLIMISVSVFTSVFLKFGLYHRHRITSKTLESYCHGCLRNNSCVDQSWFLHS